MKKQIKRNIVITGSSSGIGQALKNHFIANGDFVLGISLSNDDYNCNVSNFEEMKKVFDDIATKMDKIDILIPCAGLGVYGAIELIENVKVKTQYDVNVMGVINAIQCALPLMKNEGKMVNISSICELFPIPFRSFYSSNKSAVSMLSDCLRMELCKTKIQSTAICPCEVKTNFTKNRVNTYASNEKYGDAPSASLNKITEREDKRMPIEKATKIIVKIVNKKKLKPQYIMSFRNKLLYQAQKFFPRSLVLKVLTKMFYKSKKK